MVIFNFLLQLHLDIVNLIPLNIQNVCFLNIIFSFKYTKLRQYLSKRVYIYVIENQKYMKLVYEIIVYTICYGYIC